MKKILIFLIKFYQKLLSPDKSFTSSSRHICVFHPTCSEYAILAISKYGVFKGVIKSFVRIVRCHPWQKKIIDPLN